MISQTPGTDSSSDELVLEPPRPVTTVTHEQAASTIKLDPETGDVLAKVSEDPARSKDLWVWQTRLANPENRGD